MERVAGQTVSHGHKARMRDCQERRGGKPLFSWPGCRGRAPPGCRGSAPLANSRFPPTQTEPSVGPLEDPSPASPVERRPQTPAHPPWLAANNAS
jgi:hypothetical protein